MVEDALQSVWQTFMSMGSPDPRISSKGNIDFCLKCQLTFKGKQDPPQDQVKLIPVDVIWHIMATSLIAYSVNNLAIADMIALVFFFLLRPGEYTGTKSEMSPFWLCDVQLFIGRYCISPLTTCACALDVIIYKCKY
jgi:hypothetical protein